MSLGNQDTARLQSAKKSQYNIPVCIFTLLKGENVTDIVLQTTMYSKHTYNGNNISIVLYAK